LFLRIAPLLGALLLSAPGHAFSYDAIVPSNVEINTAGGSTSSFTLWGWLTPTSGQLTQSDFDTAVLTVSFSDPTVNVTTTGFFAPVGLAPVSPGEVAGGLRDVSTTSNAEYADLLLPGEALVTPEMQWRTTFTHPLSHTGTGVLTATVEVRGVQIGYSTQVDFLNTGRRFFVPDGGAQRISAVPEPATAALLAVGLVWLAGTRRRPRV
jgi:hypothetical protein